MYLTILAYLKLIPKFNRELWKTDVLTLREDHGGNYVPFHLGFNLGLESSFPFPSKWKHFPIYISENNILESFFFIFDKN